MIKPIDGSNGPGKSDPYPPIPPSQEVFNKLTDWLYSYSSDLEDAIKSGNFTKFHADIGNVLSMLGSIDFNKLPRALQPCFGITEQTCVNLIEEGPETDPNLITLQLGRCQGCCEALANGLTPTHY